MGAGGDLLKGVCWFTPLIKVCGCLFTSLGLEETAPAAAALKAAPTEGRDWDYEEAMFGSEVWNAQLWTQLRQQKVDALLGRDLPL